MLRQVLELLEKLIIGVLWCLVMPFLFLILYATIQMQAQTKAQIQDLSGVPTVYVEAHSDRLKQLNQTITDQTKALNARVTQLDKDNADYTTKKNALIADLTELAAYDPAPFEFDQCHASREQAIACHDTIVMAAQRRLGTLTSDRQTALGALLKDTAARFADFLGAGSKAQNELHAMKAAQSFLGTVQADEIAVLGLPTDKLRAMTESYDEMCRRLPGFSTFFIMPDGVTVAFFTGVMGALGAAVFSLYGRLREGSRTANEPLFRSYLTRPLLGALAGFMVYFVISAGAAFLVAPSAMTAAVNGLSPSALASLGLFAGIGAENVLRWLAEQAAGVFRTKARAEAAERRARRGAVPDSP